MNIVLLLPLALALATLQPSAAIEPSVVQSSGFPVPSLGLPDPDPGVCCACPRLVVAGLSVIWRIALLLLQSCSSLEAFFSSSCTACPIVGTDDLASACAKVVCCLCPCFVATTVIWQVDVLPASRLMIWILCVLSMMLRICPLASMLMLFKLYVVSALIWQLQLQSDITPSLAPEFPQKLSSCSFSSCGNLLFWSLYRGL